MGNAPKNTADYFPHFIGKGRKIQTIDHRYGNDGYATWYKILEKLCESPGHYLDISSEDEVMYLASYCRVSNSKLTEILQDLSVMGEIDKEFLNNGIIWSQKFSDSLKPLYKKRIGECMGRELLAEKLNIKLPETLTVEKEKKVRQKKESVIPTLEEFLEYCKSIPGINFDAYAFSFQSKYETWVSQKWKDGNKKPITNWKNSIRNCIPYFKPMYSSGSGSMAKPPTIKQTSANSADRTNWSKE